MSASGGWYWLMERSCLARNRARLGELGANDLIVELSNARLRDGLDEMDAIGDCILRDRAPGGEIGDVVADHRLGGDGHRVPLQYHQCNRALAPSVVRNADHRGFGDARNAEDQVLD